MRHHADGLQPRHLQWSWRRPFLSEAQFRRRRPSNRLHRCRHQQQRPSLCHRYRPRADRIHPAHHYGSLVRSTPMNRASLLTSTTLGALLGAAVFGAGPALSQVAGAPVTDWISIGISQAMQAIQNTMSSTLTAITGQLGANGPLAILLTQGFTQNANYSKAQVSAQQQIADATNLSMTRVQRDFRNAAIRDEHVVNSQHCAHIDNGTTITVGAGQSWKVATSIQGVGDQRGEALQGQPAYYGSSQAIEAINQLHLARYCSADEAAAGLCSTSQRPNADQRASSLFGTGTYDGQDGVNAAN